MIYKARLDPGYPRVDDQIRFCTLYFIPTSGEYVLYSPERTLLWSNEKPPSFYPHTYEAELMRLVKTHLRHPVLGAPAEEVGLESDMFPGLLKLIKKDKEQSKNESTTND